MKEIFLIQELWMDSTENEIGSAYGYSPKGWVDTEEKAKDIVEKGKIYPKKHIWAFYTEMPQFTYKKLVKYE